MRTRGYILLLLLMISGGTSYAGEDTDEALRVYYQGDRGRAVRMFSDILTREPNNAEAQYQIAYALFLANQQTVADFSQRLKQTSDLAMANGDIALGHYMLSQLASEHNDYDRALSEIDKALALEPASVRYLRAKMLWLFEKSKQANDLELADQGTGVAAEALSQISTDPKRYFSTGTMHFEIGRWMPIFNEKLLNTSIGYYQTAVAMDDISERNRAYSWGNMSGHYLRLKRCSEARDAAENALEIMTYGSAQGNLRKAKACIRRTSTSWLCRYLNFCA